MKGEAQDEKDIWINIRKAGMFPDRTVKELNEYWKYLLQTKHEGDFDDVLAEAQVRPYPIASCWPRWIQKNVE